MRGFSCSLLLVPLLLLFVLSRTTASRVRANTDQKSEKSIYVVYMGATNSAEGALTDNYLQLLAAVIKRKEHNQQQLEKIEKTIIVHTYKHGFSGFATKLSKEEAERMARKEGVVSVFEDPIYQLHTTRSWDFLQYQTDLETNNYSSTNYHFSSRTAISTTVASDTIIGVLDTGIWPESESFNDKDMGPIPSTYRAFPVTAISSQQGAVILSYINSMSYC